MKQRTVKKAYDSCATLAGAEVNGRCVGQIQIMESAVIAMVKNAALSVEGVTRISGYSLLDNLAELVGGSRKLQDRSIAIRFSGDSVSVEISVNILYGSNIPKVAAKIQRNITDSIVNNSGLKVADVSVNIRDLEEPAPVQETAPETETEKEEAK